MTVDRLLAILQAHDAALQVSAWTQSPTGSPGPALYLDSADTRAAIAELTRLRDRVQALPAPEADRRPAGTPARPGGSHGSVRRPSTRSRTPASTAASNP